MDIKNYSPPDISEQDFQNVFNAKNPSFLDTLKEINECAEFVVKMTGCRKANALRALFQIFAKRNDEDYSPIIALVSEWC